MLQMSEVENGFSFVESQFSAERELEIRKRFGADVAITPMALREIVLAQFTADLTFHE
jgi:hypothetical protein